ncbi:MAG TPA: hypothetical protein PLB97_00075 [Accumulibacter sp.]|nr:hypothetical protein [Accumulibacter sp.]HPP45902.1 hypothetical protein [Accumulibacter sp.]
MRITGRMEMTVRDADGALLARRQVGNQVLRDGALLVAQLFAGTAGVGPIDFVQVGWNREAADVESTALGAPPPPVPPAEAIAAAALRSPVRSEDFRLDATRRDVVQVSVSTLFRPTVDLPEVSEAGLMAGNRLYNQVVFEPVTLRVGQDVTFFWEIDFPFGN